MKKFGLESTSSVRTSMSPNVKLTMDLLGKSVDPSLYRSMIGSILYLIASRLNISYNVGSHNIWSHMGSQKEKLIRLSSSKKKVAS